MGSNDQDALRCSNLQAHRCPKQMALHFVNSATARTHQRKRLSIGVPDADYELIKV